MGWAGPGAVNKSEGLVTELDQDSTRLDYSSEVLGKNVPTVIAKFLTQSSLSDGTGWVKREAEKTWEKMQ